MEIKNMPGLVMLELQLKMVLSSRSTLISFFHREGLTQQLTWIITSTVSTTCGLTLHGT